MERTKEKKCPQCGSHDINDTGNRGPFDGRPSPLPSEPAIYKCKKCGKIFIVE